jgi:NAD-dependent dihydropyrimidine dehydrogenase PreA subunit
MPHGPPGFAVDFGGGGGDYTPPPNAGSGPWRSASCDNNISGRSSVMAAVVDQDKCTACGSCVEVCPVEAIVMDEKAKVDADKCVDCGACVDECPVEAISLK